MRLRLLIIALVLSVFIPVSAQDTEGKHIVTYGDNLFRIALRYGVDIDELANLNEITNPTRIYIGQVLTIPGLDSPDAGDEISNPLVATAPIVHTVTYGESLGSIANFYGVTVNEILQGNQIPNPNRILVGDELNIWSSDVSANTGADDPLEVAATDAVVEVDETNAATHIVQRGEHLQNIAQRYGVPWTDIAEANSLTNPNVINYGMRLTIPGVTEDEIAANSIVGNVPTITASLEAPGAYLGYGRELVVKLSTQMTYAYEDGVLKYSALASTGLPATPTVRGDYKIYLKRRAQTMSGPGYYLPNVEWVMYFYSGYGFHGTYWHTNFGQPMSHGCVNLPNEDAQWFYEFASVGTPVHVSW